MSTWYQDPTTGDLALDAGIVTDPAYATQILLDNKLGFWLGEWFLDTSQGTPWLSVLGVKRPDLSALRQMIRSILLGTPPVAACNDVSLVYDSRLRNLAYSWTATLLSGAQIKGGTTPYVVEAGA